VLSGDKEMQFFFRVHPTKLRYEAQVEGACYVPLYLGSSGGVYLGIK